RCSSRAVAVPHTSPPPVASPAPSRPRRVTLVGVPWPLNILLSRRRNGADILGWPWRAPASAAPARIRSRSAAYEGVTLRCRPARVSSISRWTRRARRSSSRSFTMASSPNTGAGNIGRPVPSRSSARMCARIYDDQRQLPGSDLQLSGRADRSHFPLRTPQGTLGPGSGRTATVEPRAQRGKHIGHVAQQVVFELPALHHHHPPPPAPHP